MTKNQQETDSLEPVRLLLYRSMTRGSFDPSESQGGEKLLPPQIATSYVHRQQLLLCCFIAKKSHKLCQKSKINCQQLFFVLLTRQQFFAVL
jgi:hypothetical protein